MTALSPPMQAILDLFEGPLNEVRFADVDAPSLRRLAAEVEAAAAQVDSHEAALGAARQTLVDRQEQLLAHAQRALAYARVYAENDEELTARLAAVHLPRPAKRTKSERAEKPARVVDAHEPSAVEMAAPASASVASTDVGGADAAASPAGPVRRGKRRESTRVVALDDASMESS